MDANEMKLTAHEGNQASDEPAKRAADNTNFFMVDVCTQDNCGSRKDV